MLKDRALSAVFWSVVEAIGANGFNVVFLLILTSLLTPTDFGVAASASLAVGLCQAVAFLGQPSLLLQRERLDDGARDTAFGLSVGVAVLLAVAITLSADGVAALFGDDRIADITPIVAVAMVVTIVSEFLATLLRRDLRVKALAKRAVLASLIAGVVAVTLAALDYGPYAIAAQLVVTALATCVLTVSLTGWPFGMRFELQRVRAHLAFGGPLAGASLLDRYNVDSARIFVGLTLGVEALGVFSIASRIVMILVAFVGASVARVTISILSHVSRTTGRVSEEYLKILRVVACAALLVFAGVGLFHDEIVAVAFRAEWREVADVLPILAATGALLAISLVDGQSLIALGYTGSQLYFAALRAILGTALLAFLAPLGLIAAAAALAVRTILIETLQAAWVAKRLNVSLSAYFFAVFPPLFGAFALCVVGWGALAVLADAQALVRALVGGLVSASVFALAVLSVWPDARHVVSDYFSRTSR